MVTYSINHRAVVLLATNQTASIVPYGTVVVVDTAHDQSFVTTTTQGHRGALGIAQNQIGPGSQGRVVTAGYSGTVLVTGAVTRGHFGRTSTTAGKAEDMGATRGPGAFCQFLTDGDTDSPPRAVMFGYADPDGTGGGASDAEDVAIADAGDYFDGTDVEAALQELGEALTAAPPVAGEFHGVRVYRGTTQSLTNNAYTVLSFSAADFDTDEYWDAGAPTKLTIPDGREGYYLVEGAVGIQEASGGQRLVIVCKNAPDIPGGSYGTLLVPVSESNPGTAGVAHEVLSTVRYLDAGDYVEIAIFQNSGSSKNSEVGAASGNYIPSLGLTLISGVKGDQGDPGEDGAGSVDLTGDTGSATGISAITFDGADVTDDGGGAATVTITGGGGGGSVATDTIWNAKGDLAGGTDSDTAARLAVGGNGSVLEAASGETTGLKWSRTLRGKIQGSNGAVLQGAGFTCTRNGTGSYTITITSAFAAAPIVVGSCITTSSSRWFTADTISTTSIHVYTSSTIGLEDLDFCFIAMDAS